MVAGQSLPKGRRPQLTVASAVAQSDCVVTISDSDMVAMATGKLNGMQAFMAGKMKIKGNMMLAQKFAALVDASKSKL